MLRAEKKFGFLRAHSRRRNFRNLGQYGLWSHNVSVENPQLSLGVLRAFSTRNRRITHQQGGKYNSAKWVDEEGNTWYKTYYREDWTKDVFFKLDRISNNGTVWEFCFDLFDFPTEDDLKSKNQMMNYRIFFRQ